ncbi:MAG: cation diffusion facilitator family transporter [Acidobacteriota bacterium]
MKQKRAPCSQALPPRPRREEAFRAPEVDRARRAMAEHLAAELRLKTALLRRSVAVAVALVVLKLAAAWITNSLAILAAGLDSLLDLALSGLNWFSAVKAEKPPDPEHPFGHGKIESLMGAAQALLLAAVSVGIGVRAVSRLRAPEPLQSTHWGVLAMALSALVAFFLARSIRHRAAATESPILAAEQLHYSMDFSTHAGVVLALALQWWTGLPYLDPFMSLLIAAVVLWQVRRIGIEAVQDLLDRELPAEVQEQIVKVIEGHRPEVIAYHGLRTRRAGSRRIVNLHLVLCKAISFEASHQIVDRLEAELCDAVARSDVTIHADLCGEYCPGEEICPRARMSLPRR